MANMTADEWLAKISTDLKYKYIACHEEFGRAAGEPVRCTLDVTHTDDTKHYNHELKVAWW